MLAVLLVKDTVDVGLCKGCLRSKRNGDLQDTLL